MSELLAWVKVYGHSRRRERCRQTNGGLPWQRL